MVDILLYMYVFGHEVGSDFFVIRHYTVHILLLVHCRKGFFWTVTEWCQGHGTMKRKIDGRCIQWLFLMLSPKG